MFTGNTTTPLPATPTIWYDREELNRRVVEMWNAGDSAGVIATALNVTRNNVMGRVWRAKRRGEKLR